MLANHRAFKCLYLDLKGEILLEVLNDHNQKGKSDPQGLLGVCGACYVGGAVGRTELMKLGWARLKYRIYLSYLTKY